MLKWTRRGDPPPLPDPTFRLRADRDRFVAFAFAGSDLVLEVDRGGTIQFAAGGASELFGCEAQNLLGRRLEDWIAEVERPRLERNLSEIATRRRCPPTRFSLLDGERGRPIWLAGCCLGSGTVLHLGLRDATDSAPAPSLSDPETFRSELLHRLDHGDDDERLTLLDLPAFAEDGSAAPAGAEREALESELAQALTAFAVAPGAAGWLDTNTVGVVHSDTVDPVEISRSVGELIDGGLGASPVGEHATVDLDRSGLTPEDAGQALLYAINQFAESQGRDFTVSSLQDGLRAMVSETLTRVSTYRGTINSDAFELAFQPIVDLKTRQVSHYEVLSRLPGDRSPSEMVSFAERLGLVAEFDLRVCQRVFEVLTRRRQGGFSLALNLSGRTLESEVFARALLDMVDEYRTLARRVTFELTETAEIKQPERVAKMLTELRQLGFSVSLDDFGSGAASFHYLRAFRFDFLKIDGSYIKSTDHRDQAILRGMIALCRELGVKSIAEMIETKLQAERLKRLHVDYGQGFLFGQPGPLSSIT